ncbi:MAG: hypothetical protein H6821_05085 [Planctomycetaceae bacterium]|nr:hypothetical protein [Planctomycetales bacterium]MCB9873535.1 hypothetical protein [Planctomycetaceae bacterium]MCB9937119.1 hypothetical protein [Planctomycetaceae bacterium]HRX80788.1 hypothetical protein [Pirellulaceae bacterium]
MSVATLAEPVSGPLAAEHHHELALANERSKKIRKAAGVAAFNGWMTGIFAVTSAPFAPFSIVGFLITAGLAVVAYNEFQGRKRLLQFDESAPRFLGWNQVGFLSMIIVYCLWMIFTGLTGEGPFAAEVAAKPELAQVLDSVEGFDYIYKMIVLALYGTVIVLSVIFQGWNAYYYFGRRQHVEDYVRETPAWVLDVQRATAPN